MPVGPYWPDSICASGLLAVFAIMFCKSMLYELLVGSAFAPGIGIVLCDGLLIDGKGAGIGIPLLAADVRR